MGPRRHASLQSGSRLCEVPYFQFLSRFSRLPQGSLPLRVQVRGWARASAWWRWRCSARRGPAAWWPCPTEPWTPLPKEGRTTNWRRESWSSKMTRQCESKRCHPKLLSHTTERKCHTSSSAGGIFPQVLLSRAVSQLRFWQVHEADKNIIMSNMEVGRSASICLPVCVFTLIYICTQTHTVAHASAGTCIFNKSMLVALNWPVLKVSGGKQLPQHLLLLLLLASVKQSCCVSACFLFLYLCKDQVIALPHSEDGAPPEGVICFKYSA